MAEKHTFTQDERMRCIEIFRNNATDVSRTCKAIGIARKTFYEWYNTNQEFHDAVVEAREEMKDFAESQLYMLMKGIPKFDATGKHIGWAQRPDTACIIFFNKTKNKDRGYIERVEVRANTDNQAIDMTKLTADERKQLYTLLEKAEADPEPLEAAQ